ncbi:MAG: RNA polymerase sigma factor [Chitinophagaceae bacterium]
MENIHQIIAGCEKGDSKYQKILYENYYGYALKTVFRYIYRYEKAVDVVNDGFVKLFRNMYKFKCEEPENIEMILMGWIRRIMINTAIDELRKNNLSPEIGGIPEYVWEEGNRSRNADQLILYKDIVSIIKKLPPVYRIVFNMFVIDGCSHHEIADALGISVGTSKSNLSKARAFLQKFIKEQEEAEAWSI